MKKILITGAGSYIGETFKQYLAQWPEQYMVETVDMIDGSWREKDFSGYDAVFHVAGLAHIKATKENAYLYYEVNRDLAVDTAKKAKSEGVRQFIFLSSMSVYGMDSGVITKKTKPNPVTDYGISKLLAERGMKKLIDSDFKLCVLRPPMVYGNGCRGNFQSMLKIAEHSPAFPFVENMRSMIYIDHLCAFVRMAIDKELCGLYLPQNREYMNTSDMMKWIADVKQKKLIYSRFLGGCVKGIMPYVSKAEKAFGTLIYQDTEDFDYQYCSLSNEESVKRSAGKID